MASLLGRKMLHKRDLISALSPPSFLGTIGVLSEELLGNIVHRPYFSQHLLTR